MTGSLWAGGGEGGGWGKGLGTEVGEYLMMLNRVRTRFPQRWLHELNKPSYFFRTILQLNYKSGPPLHAKISGIFARKAFNFTLWVQFCAAYFFNGRNKSKPHEKFINFSKMSSWTLFLRILVISGTKNLSKPNNILSWKKQQLKIGSFKNECLSKKKMLKRIFLG